MEWREKRTMLLSCSLCAPAGSLPSRSTQNRAFMGMKGEIGLVYFGKGLPPFGTGIHFQTCLATRYKSARLKTSRKSSLRMTFSHIFSPPLTKDRGSKSGRVEKLIQYMAERREGGFCLLNCACVGIYGPACLSF